MLKRYGENRGGPDEPGRGRRAETLNVKELISVTFNSPLRKG